MPTYRIPIAEPLLDDAEKKAVVDVIESGRISQGERVQEFEEKIASYVGRKYGIAVHSGTCANEVMVAALLHPDMDPSVPSKLRGAVPVCTSVAVSNPLLYARVKPRFYDLDEKLCLDANLLTDKGETQFILSVDAYGSYPLYFDRMLEFSRKWHIPLLEDACVALGSEYLGKRLGSFGVMSSLSFYVNKTITTGEGGMVVTDDERIAEWCREYANHGRKKSVYHEEWYYRHIGRNAKMTDLQASIGLAQYEKLPRFLDARKRIGQRLFDVVRQMPQYESWKWFPDEVPWSFWITNMDGTVDMAKKSMELQTKYQIETRPTLPVLPYLPVYEMRDARFPMGEASQNGFLVSCSPAILEHDDLDYLCESLGKVLNLD